MRMSGKTCPTSTLLRDLLAIQFILLLLSSMGITAIVEIAGPVFEREPPDHVDFSSLSGTGIHCSARGTPRPSIKWLQADGNSVPAGDKLRRVTNNGTLVFLAFQSDDYRPDVHATVYRCIASNSVGAILSREVHIKAVVPHPPDIQVYHVHSIVGSTAVLRCHVPAILSDYVHVTSWIRDGKLWIDSTTTEGKYLIMADGELHILNVQMPESGTNYQCKAANRLTGEVYLSTTAGKVFVTVPQGNVPPDITDSKPSMLVKEGENAIIPCATQGYPLPTTAWYGKVGGGQLHPLLTGERLQKLGSGLLIKNVQVSDSGTYVCDVTNDVGSKRVETVITVTAKLQADIKPRLYLAELGKPAAFKCTVSGNPINSVRWLHNGKWLPINDGNVEPTDVLRISEVKLPDKGMYQCVVSNNFQTAQVTAELRLQDAIPQFGEVFDEKILSPGQSATLKCVVFGIPPPQLTWQLDYSKIRKNNNTRAEERMDASGNVVGVLHIHSLNVKDAGLYQCSASNKAGKTVHSSRLNVHGPPFGRPIPKQSFVAGSKVYINCPVYGYPIQVYQWEKDDRLLPINLRQAVYPNGTLVIEKVKRATDAGRYTCSAWNKNGQSAQINVHVEVSVPPKITPFSFQDQLIREGMRARLQCVVSDGDLPIRIQWLKDSQPIPGDTGVNIIDLDEFSSILLINKITPRNNGNYTCVVTNNAGSAYHTANLFVNVPPKWLKEPRDTSVALDQDVMLHCQAEGSPTPEITWMKAEGVQPGNRRDIITNTAHYNLFSNGSLLIKNAEDTDEAYYFCQASNGVDEGLSRGMHLYVNVPPTAVAINNSLIARIHQNLTLMCEVKGDEPLDVTWHRDGSPIQLTKNSRYKVHSVSLTKSKTSELLIRTTQREDTAQFSCTAKNTFGEDFSNISVTIQEAPDSVKKLKIGKTTSRNVELSWGQPFDGNSPILGYIVEYRPREMETGKPLDSKNISVAGDTTVLTITNLKPATQYQVRMFTYNKLGQSNSSEVLDVNTSEEAPSAPPQEALITAVDTHTVKVTWKPPKPEFHHGKLRGYRVGYKIQGLNDPWQYKLIDVSNGTEDLSVTIGNLKKFTIYEFIVEAYNGPGRGPPSAPILAATAEDVPSASPQDIRCTPLTAKSIHMTWQPPPPMSVNGILQGYRILYKPVDEWYESSPVRNLTTRIAKFTIEGLRKFANYSLQVLAYTKVGDGVASEPIFCRTLDDFPEAPADIMVVPTAENSVIVAWKRPVQANGILKQYDVYMREVDSPMKDVRKYTTAPTESQFEISGLRKGYRYDFWVTASTSVGEGKASKTLTQSPDGPLVAAKIVSFNEKLVAVWKSNLTLPCKAVGMPLPDQRWFIRGKPIKGSERIQIQQDGALKIQSILGQDAGNYSCHVRNEFGEHKITYDVHILEPPHPPEVTVVSTTLNSIDIKWSPGKSGGLKLEGFILQYKSELSHLRKINISKDTETFKLKNLTCGTRYEVFMSAYNRLGIGPNSPILNVSTDGNAPTSPEDANLMEESQVSLGLRLTSWISNGCPIQSFHIEYRLRNSKKWQVASDGLKPEDKHFVITNLQPATRYCLRMTAVNSAGKTTAEYKFATLTSTGGTLAPEIAADQGFVETTGLLSDWDQWLIVAVASAITALLCILIVICLCVKRKKRQQRRKRAQVGEPSKRNANKRESSGGGISFAYLRGNPEKLRLGKSYFGCGKKEKKSDLIPYATSPLTNQEMALFNNHATSPTESDTTDNIIKTNGQTPQRFARPKPYQSGFRTPTHDPYSRGMRVPHPVPIPTAPPMNDNSSVFRGPSVNFDIAQTNGGKTTTPVKSNSKYILRSPSVSNEYPSKT